jgi:hypothetical protein
MLETLPPPAWRESLACDEETDGVRRACCLVHTLLSLPLHLTQTRVPGAGSDKSHDLPPPLNTRADMREGGVGGRRRVERRRRRRRHGDGRHAR